MDTKFALADRVMMLIGKDVAFEDEVAVGSGELRFLADVDFVRVDHVFRSDRDRSD